MKNTLKGSLAALAAAGLLLGGAGTLAYWTDSETVTGKSFTAGELKLGAPDCGDGWTLDDGTEYDGTQLIVPGDELTQTCSIDLIATGEHLGADMTYGAAAWSASNALTADLTATADFKVNGVGTDHITSADAAAGDDDEITVDIKVVFKTSSLNPSQALSATLKDMVVTATQTHDG